MMLAGHGLPAPPESVLQASAEGMEFAPAHDVRDWALRTFVDPAGPLANPDHEHLNDADLLVIWAGGAFRLSGRQVVGTARLGPQQGAMGKREFQEYLFRTWNGGRLPDFVVTLSAPYCVEAAPEAVCALVEHELYHCAQARDEWGNPKYHKDGSPIWGMRGHDVEEFVGVVRRYGAHSLELQEMSRALSSGPEIAPGAIRAACSCGATVGYSW